MEIQGKLIKKLEPQTGQGKNGTWQKQEFIIETLEQYPRKVCISLWGEKVKDLDPIQVGDQLKVSINIESREFNGRWYTDVRAWRIEAVGAKSNAEVQSEPFPFDDGQFQTQEGMDDGGLPF